MKLCAVELSAVFRVGKVPNLQELFAAEAALTKHLARDVAADEACAIRVPCTEDIVVTLLLFVGNCPWDMLALWLLDTD